MEIKNKLGYLTGAVGGGALGNYLTDLSKLSIVEYHGLWGKIGIQMPTLAEGLRSTNILAGALTGVFLVYVAINVTKNIRNFHRKEGSYL